MARGRSTHAKREREQQRLERNRVKAERRAAREKDDRPTREADGEDPDIAGIVPGPQPVREDW